MLLDTTGAEARVTIVVLAGGRATRLPGKLALPIDGVPMLARVVHAMRATGAPCLIAANAELLNDLADAIRAPVVVDERPGEGPLAALASAATAVRTPFFFAVAGDMPGIDAAFVERVVAAAAAAGWPDATVPASADGMLEPLAALYATAPWLAAARRALKAGRRNVTAALEGLRTAHYRVEPEDAQALANINTPEDYERLRRSTHAGDRRA